MVAVLAEPITVTGRTIVTIYGPAVSLPEFIPSVISILCLIASVVLLLVGIGPKKSGLGREMFRMLLATIGTSWLAYAALVASLIVHALRGR